ncbi:Transmembrane and coiled-coil domains protein 1,Transmembrane and coiled-coil domains protein 2 [Acanthosepion pharaonis]|uniref:Transmembrane and coiled-coil domains protein 1,Transmembrane and coiled-coil domains protein 2 n=1 Tax=Acanthosepion pharaonis TaxID=158019 RepID=A0A812BAV7_ACAPH|nr:Transmembrane and coiled-coil domains protein 1,Transmembrane and coiled-coil domains protein 2 [Sepia pharaonis]
MGDSFFLYLFPLPNLPKKNNQDNAGSGAKPKSVTSLQPDDVQQYLSHSAEELDNLEGASSGKHTVAPLVPTIQQENGSSTTTTATTTTTTTSTTSNTPTITTTTATTTTTTCSGGIGSADTFVDESDGAHPPDPTRTKAAIKQLQDKIHKIMGQIKSEQNSKEANVNEYLRLASGADKQQILRIKTVFEKKNQKSTHSIAQLQRKLENYQRKLNDVETYGVSSHKQAKEVLRDMGQGLKDVGANIMDGLSGFSGKQPRTHGFSPRGVVDNIKGAKETLVSKPREFAHLIKNRFGSADNISQLEMLVPVPQRLPRKVSGPKAHTYDSMEENPTDDASHHGSGTLPASFKYGSEDDNSSITSGSGFGAQSSPHSASQNMAQQQQQQQHQGLPSSCMQVPSLGSQHPTFNIDYRFLEQRDTLEKLQDKIHRLADEFEVYKVENSFHGEINVLRSMLEEERYRSERLEEQLNDLTELHQNEITNMKQEISSMEEKLEYQLEERTRDMHDLLDNCQTRISKMEVQQQQQQQLISMEMVENVTFRTLLTKLINVVLAILAVILVFVSTAANLVAPFLTTRARILSTFLLIFVVVMSWRNWDRFLQLFDYFVAEYNRLLSKR